MKKTLATVWLDGCSGCHMSFLDMDERLLVLGEKVDLVYSPVVDAKTFPDKVDVTLVEGAVSSDEDLEKIKKVRSKSKTLISIGDCAVTANVPGMRNYFPVVEVTDRAYKENVRREPQLPEHEALPKLLERARPVHEYVKVDVHIPGCPPSADTFFQVLSDVLDGKEPRVNELSRFGA